VSRARISYLEEPLQGYLQARVEELKEVAPEKTLELEALTRQHPFGARQGGLARSRTSPPEVMSIVSTVEDPARLADLAASNLELKVEDAQSVLEIIEVIPTSSPRQRAAGQGDRGSDRPAGDQLPRPRERSTVRSASSTCASS
jgi:ATP-dependent Lon protease